MVKGILSGSELQLGADVDFSGFSMASVVSCDDTRRAGHIRGEQRRLGEIAERFESGNLLR